MNKVALSLAVLAASGAYVWSQWGTAEPDLLAAAIPGSDIRTGSIQRPLPASTGSTAPLAPRMVPFIVRDAPGATTPDSTPATAMAAPQAEPPPLPAPTETPAQALAQLPAADTPPPAAPPPQPQVAANVPMPRLRPAFARPPASPPVIRTAATPTAMRIAAATGTYADGTYDGPVVDAYYGLMQIEAIVQGGRLSSIRVLRYPNDRRTSIFINRQALPMLRDEVISAQSANVDIISGATLTSDAFIRSLGAALSKARA